MEKKKMKSRLYIIIGIIAVMVFIVGMSIASPSINNFDDFVYQLKEPFDGPEREEIDELTYMSSEKPLQRVLDHCEGQRKLASGEIPPRNADGSYNLIDSIGLSFQNNTHYIDNNTCEWEKLDPDYPPHDESLSIKFSPLYFEDVDLSFDWCTENNGGWNEDESTCYFENEKDLEKGIIAVRQYGEKVFGEN